MRNNFILMSELRTLNLIIAITKTMAALPSFTTPRLVVGTRPSRNRVKATIARSEGAVFSSSIRDDETDAKRDDDDEPTVTIAGKAVSAIVATVVALSAPTRSSATEVVRFSRVVSLVLYLFAFA